MAKLTAAMRNKLPKSAFAIPATRQYPIHDRVHAIDALARVDANGSAQQKAMVRAAVKRKYPDLPSSKAKS